MHRIAILVLCIAPATLFSQTLTGSISGKITNAKTLEPIPQVHVMVVESPTLGAATKGDGTFTIAHLKVGTYSLKISSIGFETVIQTNVVVTTGRSTPIAIRLNETAIELDEVTTSASYFAKSQQMSPVSSNIFDRSEVLRSPGGIQDVQRVAQTLPGVASSTDNINELIVRGGAPFENLTIMDNMEIPSINHYSNQYNSAGPINMVNADMIEDVHFSSGGYPARYGDKSSSVMDLTVREGNRNRGFASKMTANMAGLGALVEGGFADGRGAYIFSARNSLLEVLDKIVGLSSISLTSVPKYWDLQSKITYDLSPSHKLSLNLLYGDSRINIEGDVKEKDELRKNVIDSSSVTTLYPITKQYAAGLSLRSLMGKDGYSILTLYSSGVKADVDVREDFAHRIRGPEGEVLSHKILNSRSVFSTQSHEAFIGGKYELFYQVHPQHNLSAGVQYLTSLVWKDDVFAAADTSRLDLDRNGTFETGPVIVPEAVFSQHLKFGDASKYHVYVSDEFSISPHLALTLGLRYDHFTYAARGAVSPRGSITYQIDPLRTEITFAAGQYYQIHPFPYYGDRQQVGYNRDLKPMRSDHYVLGLNHVLAEGLKLSTELYFKTYAQVAVSEDFVYSANPTFWSDRFLTIGKRRSYGVELFLEQKQVKDLFGTLSISLSKSEMKDPRIPPLAAWFPSEFDYPLIVTAVGGKVVKGVRDWLDELPVFLKYPSYILPLSNEMEISFKYRYQTGRPYTPHEYVTWKQNREGGVRWSNGAWTESNRENSARYRDYSRLDIQWLSRYYFGSWNINLYFALMNVMNTKNVFFENRRSDGTVETVYQFAFFPVFGFEAEF